MNGSKQELLRRALAIGASAVCIRTTNEWLGDAIAEFQAAGVGVYGWRWPAVRNSTAPHHYADDEAAFAVGLIGRGLDGYIVDPEADMVNGRPREVDYWNDRRWAPLATRFAEAVNRAGKASKPTFLFGVTSGGAYPTGFRDIPWAEFIAEADAVYPQAYWRGDGGAELGGTPESAYRRSVDSWVRVSNGKPIVPIIGQIARVSAQQISDYRTIIDRENLGELHFYSWTPDVPEANWTAIQNL